MFILTQKINVRIVAKEEEALGTQHVRSFYHASFLQPCIPIPVSQESLSAPTDAGSRGKLQKNSTIHTVTYIKSNIKTRPYFVFWQKFTNFIESQSHHA